MNAFEDSKNGLLVKHLQPLLHKNIGIDMLVSELKEGKQRHQLSGILLTLYSIGYFYIMTSFLFLDDIENIQEKFK